MTLSQSKVDKLQIIATYFGVEIGYFLEPVSEKKGG